MKKYFALLILLLIVLSSIQSQTVDTVFHKRHYTFIKYYSRSNARNLGTEPKNTEYYAFGNYTDSLQDGHWIYFYPTGKVFAKGNYKKGHKIGIWTYNYFGSDEPVKVKYSRKWIVTDEIKFDKFGQILMIDTINDAGEIWQDVHRTVHYHREMPVNFL